MGKGIKWELEEPNPKFTPGNYLIPLWHWLNKVLSRSKKLEVILLQLIPIFDYLLKSNLHINGQDFCIQLSG